MILSCDPPRHAFLVHFGTRRQPGSLQVITAKYQDARVEIALRRDAALPTLVAVHFVRGGFRLPFIGPRDSFGTSSFHIESGRRDDQFFFHLSWQAKACSWWRAVDGLDVLFSEPAPSGSDSASGAGTRPVLHGLLVNLREMEVDVDASEFKFEFGTDLLKDVPVTLFVERVAKSQ